MDLSTTAKRLASLGHEARLELFRLLVEAGKDGLSVGELQSLLDRPASTLAFHLRELVAADLISQRKEGRVVRCSVNHQALDEALEFVRRNCCKGLAKRTNDSAEAA